MLRSWEAAALPCPKSVFQYTYSYIHITCIIYSSFSIAIERSFIMFNFTLLLQQILRSRKPHVVIKSV